MLHAPMRVVGLLMAALLPAAFAHGQTNLAPDLVQRLQTAHAALQARPDPGALLARWPDLAADLLRLVNEHARGRATAAEVRTLAGSSALPWSRLQGAWLPLYGGSSGSPTTDSFLRELGVLPPGQGAADPLAFLVALECLSPQADGTFTLAANVQSARAAVLPPAQRGPDDATVAGRLHAAIWWDGLARVRSWPLVSGSTFRVVARADLPWPPADQPLARAFVETAAGGPAQYAAKWQLHGGMVEQLERLLRREETGNRAALLAFYAGYYKLLCHAVIPITPFRPRAADETGRVFHFAQPWEEDQPQQSIFSHEGHLLQITTLHSLLGEATVEGFDPGRHVFLVPFDVAASGERWQVRSRRFGYLGYLDAFATRDYPSILRPFIPERAAP